MTVVDTSALMAILLQEADANRFARAIELDRVPAVPAATPVEAGAVALGGGGEPLLGKLKALIANADFLMINLTSEHAELALEAYPR